MVITLVFTNADEPGTIVAARRSTVTLRAHRAGRSGLPDRADGTPAG